MPTSFRKKTALLSPKPGTPAPKASVRLFSSPGLSETIRNPVIKNGCLLSFCADIPGLYDIRPDYTGFTTD